MSIGFSLSILAEKVAAVPHSLRMAGWLNEEKTAVDTSILNVALTLGCKLLSEIRGVLILDVLDNRVPARFDQQCPTQI